jgi:small ubiquitin-related modifier
MDAFCERQGKRSSSVRFLFDGTRVRPENTPDTVSDKFSFSKTWATSSLRCLEQITDGMRDLQLEMTDSDTLEVHQEQIGG